MHTNTFDANPLTFPMCCETQEVLVDNSWLDTNGNIVGKKMPLGSVECFFFT